ncbi:MAG: hypothetical protein KBE23_09760 [Chloroflexi bacterium]|nr:hypothetical protein [Chloroflexota bacterium]MBP7043018.1 hypothetical protein [Chloroflexota bacterium]
MSELVELNGRYYRWSGDVWLDAQTYVSPPGVIQQELNSRYGHLVGATAVVPKKPKTAPPSSASKGIQKTIGPIIFDFVRYRYAETQDFVHRDEIAQHLLDHAEARAFLQQAYAQTDQKMTFENYVGNQVDWLSANMEDPNRSEFKDLLEKGEMADGKKGFRPRAW